MSTWTLTLMLYFAATTYSLPQPSILIYGGVEANVGEFPWMVSIQVPDKNGAIHNCGGTIVSLDKIVTAAHCVTNIQYFPQFSTRVVAGAHNLSNYEEAAQMRSIDKYAIKIHHQYVEQSDVNLYDIAVIQVSPPFTATSRVFPVQLPPADLVSEGNCTIIGWGATKTVTTSDVLMKATVPIVSKLDCEKIYNDKFHRLSQICAGGERDIDTCLGDTGGPLICRNIGYDFFAGVSVSGFFCGQPGKPGIYTEISSLISWIHETTLPVVEDILCF